MKEIIEAEEYIKRYLEAQTDYKSFPEIINKVRIANKDIKESSIRAALWMMVADKEIEMDSHFNVMLKNNLKIGDEFIWISGSLMNLGNRHRISIRGDIVTLMGFNKKYDTVLFMHNNTRKTFSVSRKYIFEYMKHAAKDNKQIIKAEQISEDSLPLYVF